MSKWHDYEKTCGAYDDCRNSVGADIMAAMVQFRCRKPLQDLHVLDAGCGTGNYSKQFLEYGIGRVSLLDASDGMLEKAKEKLSDYINTERIPDVIKTKMPLLPFPDNTFDALLFNLVLHHLEDTTGERQFRNTIDALREAKRVVKRNGPIIISTVLPSTARNSIWYCQVHSGLLKKYLKLTPTVDEFNDIFELVGLDCFQKFNILGGGALKDYYNFEGPLDENWRKGNSWWTFATEDEMREIQVFIKDLKEKGELETWGRQHDKVNSAGLLTVFMLSSKN